MYNYKIKILCKSEDILCYNNEDSSNKHLFCNNEDISTNHLLFYNNEEISKKNPNNQNLKNLKKLINNTIIEKALILHKKIINNTTNIEKTLLDKQLLNFTKKKPLKCICNCGNEISTLDFESFTTKSSFEIMCKGNNEIKESDFQIFIKRMKYSGFSSSESNTIHLIKINDNKSEEIILKYNFQSETKIPIENNYKIKIEWTSKDDLCYNNEEISINIINNLNLKELIKNTNYINNFKYIELKTKSLEFFCKSEILNNNFKFILKDFIKDMQNIGFFSNKDIDINLICNKNTISKYKFQSIIKIPIYIYSTQFLYKNTR